MTRTRAVARLSVAFPAAAPDELAGPVRSRVARGRFDAVERVWIVDGDRLLGVVPVQALLEADPERPIRELALPPPPAVDASLHRERVALHALAHGLDAVPVTRDGRFVGVVPARTLLAVLRREHVEDLHRLAGIQREDEAAARSLAEPPTPNAAHRLPWLVVGLAGSLIAGGVMTAFEGTLAEHVTVAFFVPAIVYLADAVGTQTEAIVVRGLAHAHLPLERLVLRELGTGVLLGAVLGGVAGPAVALAWGEPRLGVAVAVAVCVSCTCAATIGLVLPWTLSAWGKDPAFGSGPLATVVQDVLSIALYLGIARALV